MMQEYVLPGCNQKQDAIRDKIKGRRPQTYLRPDRKCMMGERAKIFYYNFFDEHRNLFGDLSVFEFDPANFEIRRRIYASRARWDDQHGTWILEDGWSQGFHEQRAVAKEFVSVCTAAVSGDHGRPAILQEGSEAVEPDELPGTPKLY